MFGSLMFETQGHHGVPLGLEPFESAQSWIESLPLRIGESWMLFEYRYSIQMCSAWGRGGSKKVKNGGCQANFKSA